MTIGHQHAARSKEQGASSKQQVSRAHLLQRHLQLLLQRHHHVLLGLFNPRELFVGKLEVLLLYPENTQKQCVSEKTSRSVVGMACLIG